MNAIPPFDAELLRRYDQPGPRYTSYPTAPRFAAGFGEAAFRSVARLSNQDPIPRALSLYAHIPFCFSPCFYCGCNRVITRDARRGEAYLARLVREIALVAPLFDRDREVVQLHLGGGTPNFLAAGQLGELMETFNRHFHFAPEKRRDFSIEIDPRTVNAGDIEALAFMGFNRASLGVQDFDPVVQKAVNRIQSVEQTLAVIEACRKHAFRSVNVDLIYGLPAQTPEGFGRTLETVGGRAPGRLAIYGYAHMPHMFKAQRRSRTRCCPRRQPSWRCCNWRSKSSPPPATATSAWTTSRCRRTNCRWRRKTARCTATSWATPPTPTPTWSASASARSATSATASARIRATCRPGRPRSTPASCPPGAACCWSTTTCCAPT
jgi:oxygen-independent coproporphyrinogen III oxidase